jgi:tRNA pseudouridine38-40 synthase
VKTEKTTRIKLIVSYDGTDYCGWQRQKPHKHASEKPSLQETVEKAASKLFNEPIDVSASGRTDAGVHAQAQVCHFDTTRSLPKDIPWAMRSLLPASIVVKAAWEAPKQFHSTLSAEKKTYRYWIWNDQRPTALMARYTHWVRQPLDLDYLNQQALLLCKEQDFKSFQSVGTPVAHTVREIYSARWTKRQKNLVQFEVTGSGFLKQMVRNIVGTQLDLFQKNQPLTRMQEILDLKDRKCAGATAPAQGLFLWRVFYPSDLDNKCRPL